MLVWRELISKASPLRLLRGDISLPLLSQKLLQVHKKLHIPVYTISPDAHPTLPTNSPTASTAAPSQNTSSSAKSPTVPANVPPTPDDLPTLPMRSQNPARPSPL